MERWRVQYESAACHQDSIRGDSRESRLFVLGPELRDDKNRLRRDLRKERFMTPTSALADLISFTGASLPTRRIADKQYGFSTLSKL